MAASMRAAVLTEEGEIQVEERAVPEPRPDDVVVRVGACGVCMTDYHIFHGAFDADPPVVLGHESAGGVTATGADVGSVAVGDRVAIDPIVPCGACRYCRQGRDNLCDDAVVVGGAGDRIVDGSFAEYLRVPARSVEDVGDLAFERAAFAEPLGCVLRGVERTDFRPGDAIALVGAGPIGLLLVQAFRIRGAGQIVVSELEADRRELALDLGADHVVDPESEDPADAVEARLGGKADVAVEVVGSVPTIEQAREMTRKGGSTLVFGVPPQDATWEISPFDVYFRELDVLGTYALTGESFGQAVTYLGNGRIETEPLITEEYGLDGLTTAFDRMAESAGLKKVIRPGGIE